MITGHLGAAVDGSSRGEHNILMIEDVTESKPVFVVRLLSDVGIKVDCRRSGGGFFRVLSGFRMGGKVASSFCRSSVESRNHHKFPCLQEEARLA